MKVFPELWISSSVVMVLVVMELRTLPTLQAIWGLLDLGTVWINAGDGMLECKECWRLRSSICAFRGVYILNMALNEDCLGAECGRLDAFRDGGRDAALVGGRPQASCTVEFSSMLEVARSLLSV